MIDQVAVVTPYDLTTRRGYSHYLVAQRVIKAWKQVGQDAKLYHFEVQDIPEKNIVFIGDYGANSLAYLARFLPEKKVLFYGSVEGFPIIPPMCMERKIAEDITTVVVSNFVKEVCLEPNGLPVAGVVYHGIDMADTAYDTEFENYVTSWAKTNKVVLAVVGNMERKGIDNFLLACKYVERLRNDVCFILHSGGGATDIRRLQMTYQLKNLWFTNMFGLLSEKKLNALYHLCDVHVLPSYCEGFGIPLIEAYRFSKWNVAVDAQPMNEIVVNKKTGLLVPVQTTTNVEFANQIKFLFHQYYVEDLADAILHSLKMGASKAPIVEQRKKFELSNYEKLLKYM